MFWDLSVSSSPAWEGWGLRCCHSGLLQHLLVVLYTALSSQRVSGVASEFGKFFFRSWYEKTRFWGVGSRWQPEGAEKVPLGFIG